MAALFGWAGLLDLDPVDMAKTQTFYLPVSSAVPDLLQNIFLLTGHSDVCQQDQILLAGAWDQQIHDSHVL